MSNNRSIDHIEGNDDDINEKRTSKKIKVVDGIHQTTSKIDVDLGKLDIETSMLYSNLVKSSKQQAIQLHRERKLNENEDANHDAEFLTPPAVHLDMAAGKPIDLIALLDFNMSTSKRKRSESDEDSSDINGCEEYPSSEILSALFDDDENDNGAVCCDGVDGTCRITFSNTAKSNASYFDDKFFLIQDDQHQNALNLNGENNSFLLGDLLQCNSCPLVLSDIDRR